MNEEDKNKRVQQMCNFIIQEAKEKVNEIKLKTENDFALEKQMLVHSQKIKLQQEFKDFEKNIETQKRVNLAKAESQSRTRLLQERDKIVLSTKEATMTKLKGFLKDKAAYKKVLLKLIVQGLIKMNEKSVTVICSPEDKSLVEEAKVGAIEEYKALIKSETKESIDVTVDVETTEKMTSGGVKIVSHKGKLVCDNSLESRVEIAFEQMMPQLRQTLFTTKI